MIERKRVKEFVVKGKKGGMLLEDSWMILHFKCLIISRKYNTITGIGPNKGVKWKMVKENAFQQNISIFVYKDTIRENGNY